MESVTNNKYREDPSRNSSGEELPPHVLTRFFLGCITQPLDSMEEYFGEKVAFYFTWLQHTASRLVFLSVSGSFSLSSAIFQISTQLPPMDNE